MESLLVVKSYFCESQRYLDFPFNASKFYKTSNVGDPFILKNKKHLIEKNLIIIRYP